MRLRKVIVAVQIGLSLVLASKADYVLMDEVVVQYILEHYPNEAKTRLSVGTTPLVKRPLYLAVRRSRPDADSIVERFNAQLRGMIADRTYHRLLHVGWIRADVDGDGLAEYIAQSDSSGPSEPERAYTLFAAGPEVSPQVQGPQKRYMFGGAIYDTWSAVPEKYKNYDPQRPEPGLATAPIYKFTW